jgi:hypothetical protein
MKRVLIAVALAVVLAFPGTAMAINEEGFDKYAIEKAGVELSDTQAGAHADFTTVIDVNESKGHPMANTRDVVVDLPPGLFGNPNAFPKCTPLKLGIEPLASECPVDSQIGVIEVQIGGVSSTVCRDPIYNMPVPGGDTVARFGFYACLYPIFIDVRIDPATQALVASVQSAPAAAELIASKTTFWGVPGDPVHDAERITPNEASGGEASPPGGRSSGMGDTPFMTNPTGCEQDRQLSVTLQSYQRPDKPVSATVPFPKITGCGAVEFNPTATLAPTTSQGTSGTGLDYDLSIPTFGIEHSNLLGPAELKRAEVVLPQGMSINPSEAEGLGVCSKADLARETYDSAPNVGCPETSKIGSVEVTSTVIDRRAVGSLYLAKPYDNPFGSLLALYMVLKIPDRGVLVKVPGKVTTDPITGQITTVFDDIPQLPVATFHLHFKEGARAPLVTPAACGSYAAVSNFTPWSALTKPTLTKYSPFEISSGPFHGPCPTGGLPPFRPGLLAGTLNNAAGSYSPFYVRLSRSDAEQEITHFSIKLPRGVVGKLAGIPFCSDAEIAAAMARSGAHGGEEELAAPSCPVASEIGHTLVGAGVGDVLVYVPGKVYLAGPYHGAPISIVAITAAKAGPFDLGTVVVREALRVNPETAEVFIDATGSDPIPHIIQGIPVRLRDIRVYVDRPEFVLNPTNCTATSTTSTVLGAGLDFVSAADDNPLTVASPFQAADCAALPFKPKLALSLKGGSRRNQVPALKAVVTARKGDANISGAEVVLPHSEFLEQGHIGTVCTRAQFNAGAGNGAECPAASVYGRARAVTPLLSEPLEGPVFLRSNGGERVLPDLVAALHGQEINFDLVGFIGSVSTRNKHGEVLSRIRTRFATAPDAPVSRFVFEMRGGKKGLLVNSTDLCVGTHRAEANFSAQNGRQLETRPAVKASCGKGHHAAKGGGR